MICRRLLACGSSVFAELLEQGREELDEKQDLVDELVQEVVEEVIEAASVFLNCFDRIVYTHPCYVQRSFDVVKRLASTVNAT